MPDYFVKFQGHLLQNKKPEGFPDIITKEAIYRVEDLKGLQDNINLDASRIIQLGGMVADKFPDDPTHKDRFDDRMFVPLHMIGWVDTVTKKMASDMPDLENPETIIS